MIYNRTESDINAAKKIRSEKLQNGQALTSADIEVLERGTLTINTLNRIEHKQAELKELFVKLGYFDISAVATQEWTYSDYFLTSDFNRILGNLDILKKAFFVYTSTPATPGNNYLKYQTINDVEKNLFDLETMINNIKDRYRFCGTFTCGEENVI